MAPLKQKQCAIDTVLQLFILHEWWQAGRQGGFAISQSDPMPSCRAVSVVFYPFGLRGHPQKSSPIVVHRDGKPRNSEIVQPRCVSLSRHMSHIQTQGCSDKSASHKDQTRVPSNKSPHPIPAILQDSALPALGHVQHTIEDQNPKTSKEIHKQQQWSFASQPTIK